MRKPSDREIAAVVKVFKKERCPVWRAERKKYQSPKNLGEAIAAAVGLRDGDRIQDHQRRVGRTALKTAKRSLEKVKIQIGKAKQFCQLYKIVEGASKNIPRFGELAVYDVSFRIGIFREKWPDFVYLHAGTREGAYGIGFFGKKIAKKALPAPLRKLKPFQIEDFLCINKDFLNGRKSVNSACSEIRNSCERYAQGLYC